MISKGENIICFGEVLWDNLPEGPKPGGATMNVAIHLAQLGCRATVISRIGKDAKGRGLVEFMDNSGLDTRLLQEDNSLPTSEVLVHLDQENNPTYEICEPVAWDNIELNDEILRNSRAADMIIYGSLASRNQVTRNTMLTLLEQDCFKVMDINLRPPSDNKEVVEKLMKRADMLKLNENELDVVTNLWNDTRLIHEVDKIRWIADHFDCQYICVTKGEDGAVLFKEGKVIYQPGYKVQSVDNVGAGDAFLAGILSCLVKGVEPEEALRFACATGAYVATKSGATPKYNYQEIIRIMDDQKTKV